MTTDLTLYELTAQRRELLDNLLALNLDEQTVLDTLDGDSTAIAAKVQDYGYVILNLQSFADAIQAEEDRLAARRKSTEKRLAHIKEWLLVNMVACEYTKVECPAFSVTVKDNPPAVVIDNLSAIPDEYLTVPELPAPVPNKKALKRALEDGFPIPGCHLAQGKRVEIK